MRITDRLALVAGLQFGISGPLDCNVWAVRGPSGVALIDSGGGTHTDRILDNLGAALGTTAVDTLLLTHTHPDHCFGAAALRERTGCRVAAPRMTAGILETGDVDRSGLRKAQAQGIYPPDFLFRPCAVDLPFDDGQTISAAGLDVRAIHVAGHSPDCFCFLVDRWLFTGDVLFYGGVLGVTNFDGSGMDGYRRDMPKLGELSIDGLFPGHGLFTLTGGQRHLEAAIAQSKSHFMPRQVGQWDSIF